MSDHKLLANVTLAPLGAEDTLSRQITLSSIKDTAIIGRSSKRGVKGRIPDQDNGWFESRVMSRDHAELHMGPGMHVNIEDLGSTHGTWLNNKRLGHGDAIPVFTGDVIRFGVDVERGEDVFPALVVRCKVDFTKQYAVPRVWSSRVDTDFPCRDVSQDIETPQPVLTSGTRHTSTNTFCVPEDDSDVEEIPNPKNISTTTESAAMITPPLTSSDILKTLEQVDCHPGDPRKPLLPRQLMGVTPPNGMLPLEPCPAYDPNSDKVNWLPYKGDNFSNVDRGLDEDFEEESDEDEDGSEMDSDSSSDDSNAEVEQEKSKTSLIVAHDELSADSPSDAEYAYDSDLECPSDVDWPKVASDVESACDASDDSDDESYVEDENEKEFIDPSLLAQWPVCAPSKDVISFNPAAFPPKYFTESLAPQSNFGPYKGDSTGLIAPTKDVKNNASDLHDLHVRFPRCPIKSLLNCTPVQSSVKGVDVSPSQAYPSLPSGQSLYFDGPFSCTDIVDKEVNDDTWGSGWDELTKVSLKRKAHEMETQDAQLPETIPELIPASSQESSLNSIQQSEVTSAITSALSEVEPPSKRVKSSHSSSLATYTATAVISALLGGLGTIALLAALPAEYFQ
ncbi:hypothetical protein N7454_008278 [Penicillium verhagenii]|nr:hypothetical protein N7454_008278 [Penicillium verhagenii]